jgi:ectoine hydroxylase-related dioxygenase (phytanoyl-CoA dioxygenase family)
MMSEKLSPEQVEFFEANGYLILRSLLSQEILTELHGAIEQITAEELPKDKSSTRLEWEPELVDGRPVVRRIYQPIDQHPAFKELAMSNSILDRVECLLGPNLCFHHSKLNMKPGRVGSVVEWHQDLAYFPHTNTDILACLIYLDDATEENGCLQIVPRQHKSGLLNHARDGLFRGKITDDFPKPGMPSVVACEAPAGSVIFMHCMTPHSSLPNRSKKSRRTLIYEYRAADAFPIYFHEHVTRAEAAARLVRGEPSSVARFTLTTFPMPQLGRDFRSLYELQESDRKAAQTLGGKS